jgi:hypothetical protein
MTGMSAAIFRISLRRRVVALVAAYALALQGLLAAFVAVAPSTSLDPVICTAGAPAHGADGHDAPPVVPHGPDCPICPLACAGAAVLPPVAAVVAAVAADMAPPPQPVATSFRPAVLRAGLARAPPA